jgi:Putative cyclase
MDVAAPVPSFNELPRFEKTGDRHAWEVWGERDALGSVNRLTPERVLAACQTIRQGKMINLDLELTEPFPNLRPPYRHEISVSRSGRDDHLDGFYLQGSSQIDGLGHVRYREYGYWGGREDDAVDKGEIGINHWAKHGLVGRGVLIDVERFAEDAGYTSYDVMERLAVGPEAIAAIAAAEGVQLAGADFLLLRTGWQREYRRLEVEMRQTLLDRLRGGNLHCPGLDGSRETARWLWDQGTVGVLADNLAVEVLPVDREVGFQHRRLIALMGMVVGELLELEDLSEDCASDGQYEFFTSLKPLRLPGGVGSPSNAFVIK